MDILSVIAFLQNSWFVNSREVEKARQIMFEKFPERKDFQFNDAFGLKDGITAEDLELFLNINSNEDKNIINQI